MEIEGQRVNSVNYHNGDGFFYRKTYSKGPVGNVKLYVECVLRDCRGRGKIDTNLPENIRRVEVTKGHNHGPDLTRASKQQFITEVKRRAATAASTSNLKQIFDEVSERMPEGAATVGFAAVESTMYRRRRRCLPRIPNTLDDFAAMLHTDDNIRQLYGSVATPEGRVPFFRGLLEGEGGSRTAVFATPQMCERLRSATELFADGTFKVVPRVGGMQQLFSIHAAVGEYTFPVLYALMTRRTATSYRLLLAFAKHVLAPGMAPRTVMSDYEGPLVQSLREAFPAAAVTGCWFHVANAMWKKCQTLRLVPLLEADPMAAKAVRMAMALPLLPQGSIPAGLEEVTAFVERHGLAHQLGPFTEYVRSTWVNGTRGETVSVYKQKRRTNNSAESFHARLSKIIGHAHPSFWTFLVRLAAVTRTYELDLVRYERGERIRRPAKRQYLANGRRIKQATATLDAAGHPGAVADFLAVASHAIGGQVGHFRGVALRGDRPDADDVEEDAVNVPAAPPVAPGVVGPEGDVVIPPELRCSVCLGGRVSHVIIPCDHFILCGDCQVVLAAQPVPRCPLCRQRAESFRHLYLAGV